jgi:hypothetical protein
MCLRRADPTRRGYIVGVFLALRRSTSVNQPKPLLDERHCVAPRVCRISALQQGLLHRVGVAVAVFVLFGVAGRCRGAEGFIRRSKGVPQLQTLQNRLTVGHIPCAALFILVIICLVRLRLAMLILFKFLGPVGQA